MAAFPFSSAYGPVDALATRQMQINAAEQARQIEMARMQQAREAQMTQAMLQQKQLQDNQAAREMQAALSFRQQAEVEAHNRAVLGDAVATRNAQLVWNQKDLDARERMHGEQLKSTKEVAGMQFSPMLLSPRVAEAKMQREIEVEFSNEEIDARNSAAEKQAQLDNRKLSKAAEDAKRHALNPQNIPFVRRLIPWGKIGDVDVDQLEASLTQILTESPRDPKGRPLTQYDPETKTFKAVIVPKKTSNGDVIVPGIGVSNPFFGISKNARTPSQADQSVPATVAPVTPGWNPVTNTTPARRARWDLRTGQLVPY